MLQHERPQTIALILSYTDSEQAAQVIAELPEDKKIPVVECIARMESASPEAIKLVESQLRHKFDNILTTDYTVIGGVDYIADVMNHMDRSNEKAFSTKWEKTIRSLQIPSGRRCSFSRISSLWTNGLYSVLSATAI